MLFNSPQFLFVFLPIVVIGFALLGRFGRNPVVGWLSLSSLAFYGYWRPSFLILLLGSILVNYGCAALIWRNEKRPGLQKFWMIVGISLNLAALGFYKYLFPFLHFLTHEGLLRFNAGDILLPLGISFFTFTQIAYLIDLSQGAAEPQDFVSYVLFVTFFPHLIAGPILHHGEMMPQFAAGRDFRLKGNDVVLGLSWFVMGLAKKVLIADRLAHFADTTFADPAGLSFVTAWLGLLNYVIQLYFDFSGYSDMAIGLARIFSIQLPFNFNSPYKAPNIIEYWQRWHMTLTRYLTLYLYNPISMAVNRRRMAAGKSISRKVIRTPEGFASLIVFPTVVTMFLAGVWHGAGLQFLLFGLLHGFYISANHAWRIFVPENSRLARIITWRPLSVLLTFTAASIAEVFFRSNSTHGAFHFLAGMSGAHGMGIAAFFSPALARFPHAGWSTLLLAPQNHFVLKASFAVLLLPVVWFLPNTQEILGQVKFDRWNFAIFDRWIAWRPTLAWATSLAVLFIAVLWNMTDTSSFLYFQF